VAAPRDLTTLVSRFGERVAAKFATGGGEPEDHRRGPLEELLAGVAELAVGSLITVTQLTSAGVPPVPARARRPPTDIEARSPTL
jgi:hypothetical protein